MPATENPHAWFHAHERAHVMKQRMKISRGGQISIPAAIRHRWATTALTLEDLGDRIVLAPAADDPIAAAEGILAEFSSRDVARARRKARKDERASDGREPRA